ncbi:HMA2 domain-containing protein [Heyndrickxia sp. NPDC080065]|uniref:HMA2 domain-containing protein n=1 Tax=Heyndrickxia sp. NPDC080065 TaxID=3390568 RepID=UPI003D0092E6
MISSIVSLGASLIAPKLLSQFSEQKIKIIHAMPGRLRLQCDKWKHKVIVENIEKKLKTEPLVLSCEASHITGSLLIKFTVPHITQLQLDELMKVIVTAAADAILHTDAKLMNMMQQSLHIVDKGIKKQTSGFADFDSLFTLFLLGKGLHSFKSAPTFSASLLYWAYTIIKKGENKKFHEW